MPGSLALPAQDPQRAEALGGTVHPQGRELGPGGLKPSQAVLCPALLSQPKPPQLAHTCCRQGSKAQAAPQDPAGLSRAAPALFQPSKPPQPCLNPGAPCPASCCSHLGEDGGQLGAGGCWS